jgi:hypothetical protein
MHAVSPSSMVCIFLLVFITYLTHIHAWIGVFVVIFAQFATAFLFVVSSALQVNVVTLLQKETSLQPGSSMGVPGKCM